MRAAAAALSRLYLSVLYAWRHGRWPTLDRPLRFTEWVQWRKLHDHRPHWAVLTDKLASKALAASIIGEDQVVPTLWEGAVLPPDPPAPLPLVVKSNHGCNQVVICRTPDNWAAARRASSCWAARAYGGWLGEGGYVSARRTILVEPYLGDPAKPLPHDYKVYVFGGRASVVQLHVGRGVAHRWTQFDRNWKPLSDDPILSLPPSTLTQMLSAAERLAGDFDFLRVDFYEVDGKMWFGEFCLYPGSGLDPFHPDRLDFQLGAEWAQARNKSVPDVTLTEAA